MVFVFVVVRATVFLKAGRLQFGLPTRTARREVLVPLLGMVITVLTKLNCSPKDEHYFPWPLDAAHAALQSGLASFRFVCLCFVLVLLFVAFVWLVGLCLFVFWALLFNYFPCF